MPLRFGVADAQNVIVKVFMTNDVEWLLFYEHDVLPPPHAFVRLGQWMRQRRAPVVSGLVFSRGEPSEPMVFRGRGNGVYTNWDMGDLVYCDGVPTGFLLIHRTVLEVMWGESEEYIADCGAVRVQTRRVFREPRDVWEAEGGGIMITGGTSDLDWCTRVIEGDVLVRAGWKRYVDELEDKRYPFIVDTRIFCGHIDMDGRIYPAWWRAVKPLPLDDEVGGAEHFRWRSAAGSLP